MREQDVGFDYHRYRQLLAEAVDEKKRLALIDLLIEERARDRLVAARAVRRATTIARAPASASQFQRRTLPLPRPRTALNLRQAGAFAAE
ncbi:MAG: hypothetical protein ACREDC_08740 [Bradyrhizobium sp.]